MVVFHLCVGGGTVAQWLGTVIVMVGGVRASLMLPVFNATHTHTLTQTQDDFSDYVQQ